MNEINELNGNCYNRKYNWNQIKLVNSMSIDCAMDFFVRWAASNYWDFCWLLLTKLKLYRQQKQNCNFHSSSNFRSIEKLKSELDFDLLIQFQFSQKSQSLLNHPKYVFYIFPFVSSQSPLPIINPIFLKHKGQRKSSNKPQSERNSIKKQKNKINNLGTHINIVALAIWND